MSLDYKFLEIQGVGLMRLSYGTALDKFFMNNPGLIVTFSLN